MDMIKRLEENKGKIAELTKQLESANKNIENYRKEKESIEKQLKQLEKKYNIEKSRKLIDKIPLEISSLENDIYIYFLKQVYLLDEKSCKKGIYIDIGDILEENGLDLYIYIGEDVKFDNLYYDKNDYSLMEYDSYNDESRTIIEFSKSLNIKDLQDILNKVDTTIDILSIYNLLKNNIKNGMISQDINTVFKEYDIALYDKTISLSKLFLEKTANDYILKKDDKDVLRIPCGVNLNNLYRSLEEELKILNIKLENDKDYQEYLRLKSIFE